MKAAYIVVEGKENADFLERILPADLLRDVQIVGMNGWYSAFSMAGTIMSDRARPVLLIIETTSDNPTQAKEREQTLTGLLLPAATAAPYEVCVALPTIAAIAKEAQDLSSDRLPHLQNHPLIQRITQFFSTVVSQAA
jgi:hypothetical protein